jgi:CheY-like chemotaxis protein
MDDTAERAAGRPPWVRFLLAFDTDFRKRRLYFLIQGQNRLYQMLPTMAAPSSSAALVDGLKRGFYKCLDALRQRERPEFFTPETRRLAVTLLAAATAEDAAGFVDKNCDALSALVELLSGELDLDACTRELDALLAAIDPATWPAAARHEVLVNYLGFPFWDVLTLSVTNWRDAGEFDEILIDRISPEDARTVRELGVETRLKGIGFAHFAAFFSRAYRENDYLLGRLQGIDRLIDIVCDSAGSAAIAGHIDVIGLKRRAFECVLAAEEKHLPHCTDLIRSLRRGIAALTGAVGRRKEHAVVTKTPATILIVDDEPGILEVTADALADVGYEILVAGDSETALQLLRDRKVDLLLTDIVMPGEGGLALADAAKQLVPGLRVVYTSGYVKTAPFGNGAGGGPSFGKLVNKPWRADRLRWAVAEALE